MKKQAKSQYGIAVELGKAIETDDAFIEWGIKTGYFYYNDSGELCARANIIIANRWNNMIRQTVSIEKFMREAGL